MQSSWYRCITYFTQLEHRAEPNETEPLQIKFLYWRSLTSKLQSKLNITLVQFQSHSLPPKSPWKPREVNGEQWPQC